MLDCGEFIAQPGTITGRNECPCSVLRTIGIVLLQYNPINPVDILVVSVKASFVKDIKKDQDAADHTNGKS